MPWRVLDGKRIAGCFSLSLDRRGGRLARADWAESLRGREGDSRSRPLRLASSGPASNRRGCGNRGSFAACDGAHRRWAFAAPGFERRTFFRLSVSTGPFALLRDVLDTICWPTWLLPIDPLPGPSSTIFCYFELLYDGAFASRGSRRRRRPR